MAFEHHQEDLLWRQNEELQSLKALLAEKEAKIQQQQLALQQAELELHQAALLQAQAAAASGLAALQAAAPKAAAVPAAPAAAPTTPAPGGPGSSTGNYQAAAASAQPHQQQQQQQHPQNQHKDDDWLKSGWMNRAVALAGAIKQRDGDRCELLVKRHLGLQEACMKSLRAAWSKAFGLHVLNRFRAACFSLFFAKGLQAACKSILNCILPWSI